MAMMCACIPPWLLALMLLCLGVARSIPHPGPTLSGAPRREAALRRPTPLGFAESGVAPDLRGSCCCQASHASQQLSAARVIHCLRGGGSSFGSEIVLEGPKGGAAAVAVAEGTKGGPAAVEAASGGSAASDEEVGEGAG
ncbi:hypothetical protein T484DRAFT_2023610, partial [Baffinella frigidus]